MTAAYLRSGFDKAGKYARFNASRLRNKPPVKARIDELLEEFSEAGALKVQYLQAQLLPLLRTNMQDLFDDNQLKSIADLPREVASAIKTIKFDKQTGKVVEVSLTDKNQAANTLFRSIGAIAPDGESNANMSLTLINGLTLADAARMEQQLDVFDQLKLEAAE